MPYLSGAKLEVGLQMDEITYVMVLKVLNSFKRHCMMPHLEEPVKPCAP